MDFTKDGAFNDPSPNYFKKVMIVDFFLLVELELNLQVFTNTH
jgi:hypothetical protein